MNAQICTLRIDGFQKSPAPKRKVFTHSCYMLIDVIILIFLLENMAHIRFLGSFEGGIRDRLMLHTVDGTQGPKTNET